jgi:hypothetical protein
MCGASVYLQGVLVGKRKEGEPLKNPDRDRIIS